MSKINVDRFSEIQKNIDDNIKPLDTFVNSILNDKFACLDDYMKSIDDLLVSDDDIPVSVLEKMLLNINSMLYWIGNGLEIATLQESMAKLIKEEVYNNAYNDASGTIGDKKSIASLNSQQEELIKICYSNAVKLYQYKIDRASEMASALKKIITRRIAELELSRIDI
jgi:hypothetical protein